MAGQELRVCVDAGGRTWERGAEVAGRPGVRVEGLKRVGSFVTVTFGAAVEVPRLPPALVIHVADVAAME
jgi:hypothetical protein